MMQTPFPLPHGGGPYWRCALLALAMALVSPVHAARAPWVGEAQDGTPCSTYHSPESDHYGPFDYTNPDHFQNKLPIVEQHHFTRRVASLQGGENAIHPLNDLHYTLRAFPNHHRALYALIRFHTEVGMPHRDAARRSEIEPECFLYRAYRFSPDDPKVPFLHGLYLHRLERYDEAESRYRQALKMRSDSAEVRYNLGLLLADMDRYEEARVQARKAYELGYPLDGLRNRLSAAEYPP